MVEVWLELECVSCGRIAHLTGDAAWRALHGYNRAAIIEDTTPVDINSRIQIDGCNVNGCLPLYLKDEADT